MMERTARRWVRWIYKSVWIAMCPRSAESDRPVRRPGRRADASGPVLQLDGSPLDRSGVRSGCSWSAIASASARLAAEEVHLNLVTRWFCRLGLDGEVPDHSTFSHYWPLPELILLRQLFETTVKLMAEGLVGAKASRSTPAYDQGATRTGRAGPTAPRASGPRQVTNDAVRPRSSPDQRCWTTPRSGERRRLVPALFAPADPALTLD